MAGPRRFSIKSRMRDFDENASGKTKAAVAAGVVILGMAVAVHFNGVDSLSEFGELFTSDAAMFAYTYAGTRGIFNIIANARKAIKEQRKNELDRIFREVEEEEKYSLGGNEDARTR